VIITTGSIDTNKNAASNLGRMFIDNASYNDDLRHIPKFRYSAGKVLANASTSDFSGTSDAIRGYALRHNSAASTIDQENQAFLSAISAYQAIFKTRVRKPKINT
jgi:hypothetical protein